MDNPSAAHYNEENPSKKTKGAVFFMLQVTYLHHSGFLVELDETVLLFDYYTEQGTKDHLKERRFDGKKLFVFASHAHGDHFDKRILRYQTQAELILSSDIKTSGEHTHFLSPNETKTIEGITVETFPSNDEGVAFLVQAENRLIFHSGDLNWWHWEGESEAWLGEIRESYCSQIDRLHDRKITVAFVPTDPRLGAYESLAAEYFQSQVSADALFPMHFWNDFSVCGRLKEKGIALWQIERENQTFVLS